MNTITTHAVIGEDVVLSGAKRPGAVIRLFGLVWNRFVRIQETRARRIARPR